MIPVKLMYAYNPLSHNYLIIEEILEHRFILQECMTEQQAIDYITKYYFDQNPVTIDLFV